ncbi:MAG TPA: hypothetical protein PKW90_23295 [Myxococcota bacterium]|nr:hypothetical protein [Myxococcota bacterium]
MEFRLDRPEAVQCVECGRFREAGVWTPARVLQGGVVTHTICPSCQPSMLDHLRWDIEFPTWSFEKQLEAVRLRVRHIPMDLEMVLEKLHGLSGEAPADLQSFVDQIRPYLADQICKYCKLPIERTDPISERAGYTLHEGCARNLTDSLHLLVEMEPPPRHLDAYMDIARIPHGVRAGVRRDMESSFLVA